MNRDDEAERLDALRRLNLLDTPPSESFDRITRMAAQIFGLPIAAVSLTDHDRQWFKSRVGVEHWSIPRDKAPCAQVAETAATVIVPDLLADDCYRTSVLAGQGVRFYAGASLTTREGHSLGALCVLGSEPRQATEEEAKALGDLAQMVMAQIELQHAFGRLDPLSGLPNRNQFCDDLSDLGRDRPGERRLAVLVDLAEPEQLTRGMRVMGPTFLDRIVREAARRIKAQFGDGRALYHVAATQFVFLSPPEVVAENYLEELGEILQRLSSGPDDRFVVSTSVGAAPLVTGQTSPEAVLRTAHSAAQDARSKPAMVGLYSSALDGVHQRRFRLLNAVGRSLEGGEAFSLVFQPRVDLPSGRCVGAEALLRWRHPALGEVPPSEFIPIVEQTALAGPITDWVIEAASAQLAQWRREGIELTVSVNISAANLESPDFATAAQLRMRKFAVRPEWIEFELTESAIMRDVGHALAQLEALDRAGVRIAIDDFGTGYSSLAYLQRLPSKVLKIDQSFVRAMDRGERERALVRSMISLGHDLGHRVVAEGVETGEARDLLLAMGCDEAQGYFFARPMAPAEFARWFASHAAAQAGPSAAAA